jgi:hypothetical protein
VDGSHGRLVSVLRKVGVINIRARPLKLNLFQATVAWRGVPASTECGRPWNLAGRGGYPLYFLNSIEGDAGAASGNDGYRVACPEFIEGLTHLGVHGRLPEDGRL